MLRIVYESAVCTLYLTGAQASGANIDVAGRTLHDRLDALDIGLPCTVGTTVRVRDLDTKCDALAADFAFCHSWHLLYRLVNKIYCNRNREKNQALFAFFSIFISFHRNHLTPRPQFAKAGSAGRAVPASLSLRSHFRHSPSIRSTRRCSRAGSAGFQFPPVTPARLPQHSQYTPLLAASEKSHSPHLFSLTHCVFRNNML